MPETDSILERLNPARGRPSPIATAPCSFSRARERKDPRSRTQDRVSYRFEKGGASGHSRVTFTNKAAREMSERVQQLVGRSPADTGEHLPCLRSETPVPESGALGESRRSQGIRVFDRGDAKSIVKNIWRS
jgi:hypothetical protein